MLLLDTNVLLVLIVGTLRPDMLSKHARLKAFDSDFFNFVRAQAGADTKHVSTPHILTEVSNLLGSGKQQIVDRGNQVFRNYVAKLNEVYRASKELVDLPVFTSIGLADTSIASLSKGGLRIVTVDWELCNRLTDEGFDVVNPWHHLTPMRR